jgi:hypothetical protein
MRTRRPWTAFLGAFWPFLLGCTLIAFGLIAIVLGYLGASGTVYVGLQVPYLVSGAALGLALVIVGTALLVVQVLTRQTRLLRKLLSQVEADEAPSPLPAATTNGDAPIAGGVFVVRGGRWFHRKGCQLLEGKRTTRMDPHKAEDQGLAPCRLCDPVIPADA